MGRSVRRQRLHEKVIEAGEPLKIVGIVCAREGVSATALSTGVAYTSDLTGKVIETASASEIVKQQLEDPDVNVFSGSRFDEEKKAELNFEDMISVDSDAISSAFGMNIREKDIIGMLQGYLNEIMNNSGVDTGPAAEEFSDTLYSMATGMLQQYVAANAGSDGKARLFLNEVESIVDDYLATSEAISEMEYLVSEYSLPMEAYESACRPLLIGLLTTHIAEQLSGKDLTALPSSASAPI